VLDRTEQERIAAFVPAAWACRVAACGGEVHEVEGLAVCLTGVPLAPFNPTLVVRLPADPDAAIAEAATRYEGTGLSIGIDLEATMHGPVRQAAARAGLTMVESRPGMTLRPRDVVRIDPPDGVELFRVEDPALLDELVEVDAAAFGGEPAMTRRFLPDAVLEDPAQRVYAARIGGRLVGAGESTTVDHVIGVFGIATLPAFRRRGIGAALSSYLLEDRAGDADLAFLDASELGLGVYRRLGFEITSTWEVWVKETG
jgi:ribosomal protein S18 acetylase RimI-like enzyme